MNELASRLKKIDEEFRAGRYEAARAILMRLLPRHGDNPDVIATLCAVLNSMAMFDQSAFYGERALAEHPENVLLLNNMATALVALGRRAEATELLMRLVRVDTAAIGARSNLAALHLSAGRLAEAEKTCREGLAIQEHEPSLTTKLATCLLTTNRAREAVARLRRARFAHPRDVGIAEQLAFLLNYDSEATAQEQFDAHAQYGRLVEESVGSPERSPDPSPPDPERRLRIGIMSPDLRSHSVAFFAEPLFEHLDRGSFEVVAYATGIGQDKTTERLRGMADGWVDALKIKRPDLAARIRADRIDVLIELSGLTAGSRLDVVALRPSPLCITYCGYPNTTGLESVDARIVDSATDPPGEADRFATERLVRLDPCFLCYRPFEGAALPQRRRDDGDAFVFGSFNAATKMNDRVWSAWARILHQTPGSRLLLKSKGLDLPGGRDPILAAMRSLGIESSRLEVIGQTPTQASHLEVYSRVDVALDTFPYNGTTTTCESLWMGVPVVGFTGATHAARVGASLLRVTGLTELLAEDVEGYVRLACGLARPESRARLEAWRSPGPGGIRETMRRSSLCDGPAFAHRFGAAIRELWRERCGKVAGR